MLTDATPPNPGDIPLELDAQVARGAYCNVAIVSRTPWEFVLDFAFVGPNQGRGLIVSRVILSPSQAEALHRALAQHFDPPAPVAGEAAASQT